MTGAEPTSGTSTRWARLGQVAADSRMRRMQIYDLRPTAGMGIA
jgi:hypothetical protein